MEYIRFFEEIGIEDIALVGGKNASLGEMYRTLRPMGVRVPNGFAITAQAYRDLLDRNHAWPELHRILDGLLPNQVADLARRGKAARELIYGLELPDQLKQEILTAYGRLRAEYGDHLSLAVRSSATAEDLPTASFAGQQDTYLNVSGEADLLDFCRRCFASLFTDRAIHYRMDEGFDHFHVALSIGVMKMVRSDLASSGVMFSLDTETGFRDVVFITSSYGLGENVVQGAVNPDEFYVFKSGFKRGKRAILRRVLGSKKLKMVYAGGDTRQGVRNIATTATEQQRFSIDDEDIFTLADYAIKIEEHYSRRAGESRPMDMEWAKDGDDGQVYIVQARPETVASQRKGQVLQEFYLRERGSVLVSGRAVGSKIAVGAARHIATLEELSEFQPGEILVADNTTPDWEPVMKLAAGIITERGGRTCHAAIIARELGIPAVVGAADALSKIPHGEAVTLSCAEGEVGNVYAGALRFEMIETDLSGLQRPKTEIMMNLGDPELAFQLQALPNDGVGLARMEFIIANAIKIHPLALLHPERVHDDKVRREIKRRTAQYANPEDYFVRLLSEGVGTIAAAFYPKPVVLRTSDFKSNEYAALMGGRDFEPEEDNPMLGFRGASRYAHPNYEEGFRLECAAIRRVREDMGLDNVIVMIPFVRRLQEADAVLAKMAEFGLRRGENGLQIYAMCEIPSNVVLIDEFAKRFDGFSIGSNDLTQMTLGVDRDSAIVAFDYDERDPAVKDLIRQAVEGCRRNGIHSGLCGQAPSDYPEMAEYLVRLGIDSISLNPDTILATTRQVLDIEKSLQT